MLRRSPLARLFAALPRASDGREAAIEHEVVNVPSSRAWLALLFLIVAMSFGIAATGAERRHPAAGPSVTVQPGDSWASVRNRMFPLDALKRANPGLDSEMLRPGDVVRAPYVPGEELDREHAAREAAESRLAETKARLAEIEKDRASIEARRREVDRAKGTLFSLRVVVISLAVVVMILVALLAFLVEAVRAARRNAAEAASRYSALQSRYEGLRQSLHELDVRLQQRIVSLLHLHGGKIVSDAELKSSMRTVLDFTQELKKKHGTG